MNLYRVENLIDNIGLWYNAKDGSSTTRVLDLDLTNKNLPMGFDESLGKDKWRSAAASLDQLKYWFSREDLLKLTPLGFKLYEINVKEIREYTTPDYSHPLFQEQSVISRKEIDIQILLK